MRENLRKMRYVLRFELLNTVLRRSFLFATIGLPLISLLVFYGFSRFNGGSQPGMPVDVQEMVDEISGAASSVVEAEGYIDQSGILVEVPLSVHQGSLVAFRDESEAQKALMKGEINAYYLISPDYLESGEIIYVEKGFNPLNIFLKGRNIRWVLNVNLLGGDSQLADKIQTPHFLQITVLEPGSQRDESNPLTLLLPYVVMLIYYSIMLMTSNLFLQGLKAEKDNRMLEVLLVSISPRQLISGKIIGLGLAGLIQTISWLGISYMLLRLSGRLIEIPAEFQLPPTIIAWGIIFYLLGYALYASMLAGIGALVSDLREASQVTTLVIMPLAIPAVMFLLFIRDPNGATASALSMIPFTAPVAMMVRLSASNLVPLWQPVVSAVLVAITTALVITLATRLFRGQNLLVGAGIQPKRLIRSIFISGGAKQ